MEWQQTELRGYEYYSKKGYRILVALVSGENYDFVAERNGDFIRVNVKTAGLKDKKQPNSWSISQASGSYPKQKNNYHVDIYLTWLPHLEKFIELSGDYLNSGNTKSKRIPKEFLI